MIKPELQNVTFESLPMQTVFQTVNDVKGIVWVHPSCGSGLRQTETAEIESAVRAYHDVTFVFHPGMTALRIVAPLVSKYPNVYYALDMCTVSSIASLLYPSVTSNANAAYFLGEVERIGNDSIASEMYEHMLPTLSSILTAFSGEQTSVETTAVTLTKK